MITYIGAVKFASRLNGVSLKQREKFYHLQNLNNRSNEEEIIDSRICKHNSVMRSLPCLVIGKPKQSKKAKLFVFNAIFFPTLACGRVMGNSGKGNPKLKLA